jgi:branched-chain amino acid transport system substrate-binding protein
MTGFHRFYRFIPVFIVMILLSACAGQPKPPSPSAQTDANAAPLAAEPVKVALLLPLTGPHAAIGQSMAQAAQLALFDVNDDRFVLLSKDTGGSAAGAVNAAREAVQEGAGIILGPLFADEVRAIRAANAAGPLNVLAFSTDWTLAGGSIYLMGFTPFDQVERLVTYAAQNGLSPAAIASTPDQYGLAASRAFEDLATKNGITISRVLSNPSSYGAVFLPAGGSALTATLPRIANPQAVKLGTGLWDDPAVISNPAMNGAVFAAPSPTSRSVFEQRYHQTYGQEPVRISSLAYDATALAAALGLQEGITNPFSKERLTSTNGFSGVDGIMRFRPDGRMERGMAILKIQGGRLTEIAPAPSAF